MDHTDFLKSLKDNAYYQYFGVENSMNEIENIKEHIVRYDNKYVNIHNYEMQYVEVFCKEDDIVVQEKIDGSNAHIVVNELGFTCFSHKCILNQINNLKGFYFWCEEHYKQIPSKYYGVSIYGEWLVPHHCRYPLNAYGRFYVFDVMKDGRYWEQADVKKLAEECGFTYVPVFYEGKFQSWKHLMSFVGKTALGGEKGEGIVVKNISTLNKASVSYIKIVDVEFQETNVSRKKIKTVDMNEVAEREYLHELTESIITEARVRKIILKAVDNEQLPIIWNTLSTDMISKIVRSDIIRDCIKEESDIVDRIGMKYFGFLSVKRIRVLIDKLKDMQN